MARRRSKVRSRPPDGCRLLEVPAGMIWDEGIAAFVVPDPLPEVVEETITEEEPSPPPDTAV